MLNIPDEVKELYKLNGIHKNLRIHFPNGELDDIVNNNIVYESPSFIESICSQDSFKFGLCEAGEIDFEVVGIENMVDCKIEVYLEIDVSSLNEWDEISKSWINKYAGRYVNDEETDLSGVDMANPMYSIPLGVYTVDESPRSRSNMQHREVTAYTKSFSSNDDLTAETQFQISQLHNKETMKIYLPEFIDCQIDREDFEEDYVRSDISTTTSGVYALNKNGFEPANKTGFQIYTDGSYKYYIYVTTKCVKVTAPPSSGTYKGMPYIYTVDGGLPPETYEDFEEAIYQSLLTVLSNADREKLDTAVLKKFYRKYSKCYALAYAKNVFLFQEDFTGVKMCPYDDGLKSCQIILPDRLIIARNSTVMTYPYDYNHNVSGYQLNPENEKDLQQITVSVGNTLEAESGSYKYSFYNAFTALDIISGYLELHAMFGNQQRNGRYRFVRLSRENPIPYDASNYKEFWWDEYDVDPIGYVLYSHNNEDITYQINETGKSIYDMTSNGILRLFGEDVSKKTIQGLIDKCFKDHLDAIYFDPVDFTAVGLPYMEDGDCIEIETPDGSTITTYILQRTMTGLQSLSDSIGSTSGEIIAGDDIATGEEPED